jgi:hypothetical protein
MSFRKFTKQNFSNKSPTRCNNFQYYYPDVYLELNMFRAFSRPSSGAHDCSYSLWLHLRIVVTVVLCSWSGRWTGPTTNTARLSPRYEGKTRGCYCSHELLMMGGRTPETCWAVNKRQDNKLKSCYIWLVIYLNCTVMHGLTNLEFVNFYQPYSIYRHISKYRSEYICYVDACSIKSKRLHVSECHLSVHGRMICEGRCVLKFLHISDTYLTKSS